MFDKLKLMILRPLTRWVMAARWWRKTATDLSASTRLIAVDGGEIRVRLFTPQGQGPFPLMLFFHGGGWVGFDIDTHDPLCRDLCSQSRHIVVSVDYRLAPEHPFPVGVMDCLASLDWLKRHAAEIGGDTQRLVLCGDSAGGNLAAVTAIQARQRYPGLIKGQVLIYPVTDHYSGNWPSYQTHGGKDHTLSLKGMSWLWDTYLRNSKVLTAGQTRHDLATPLHVKDLGDLPPCFVVLAENDLLHDEGLAYAQRLEAAGVDVQVREYANEQHGFVGGGPTAGHLQAVADIRQWLASKGL